MGNMRASQPGEEGPLEVIENKYNILLEFMTAITENAVHHEAPTSGLMGFDTVDSAETFMEATAAAIRRMLAIDYPRADMSEQFVSAADTLAKSIGALVDIHLRAVVTLRNREASLELVVFDTVPPLAVCIAEQNESLRIRKE